MARREQRRVHWAAYLWPGLPHLWINGSWAGLALAFGFTVLLNVLILATFLWTDWLPPRAKLACAGMAGTIWLAALWETRCELRRIAARRKLEAEGVDTTQLPAETADRERCDNLFRQAQSEYLAGDWLATEKTLQELLHHDRRDVEAQLLLATLWRHSGRIDEAGRQLERLSRLEDAAMWRFEINREMSLIESACEEQQGLEPTSSTSEKSSLAA